MNKNLLFVFLLFCSTITMFAQNIDTIYYDTQGKGVPLKEVASFYRVHYSFEDSNYSDIVRDYYITGELKAEATPIKIDRYDNEKCRWKGIANGYYKSGNKEYVVNRDDNGAQTGDDIRYFENGKIQQHAKYKNDYLSEYVAFNDNGQKTHSVYFTNPSEEIGTITHFDDKGQKSAHIEIEKNSKNGSYKEFYPDGKLKVETTMLKDSIHGMYTFYYEGDYGYYTILYDNNKPVNNELKLYDSKGYWLVTYDYHTFDVKPKIPTSQDCKIIYNEGNMFQFYVMNGVRIVLNMNKQNIYGDWYVVGCEIMNYSKKPFDFIFENMDAQFVDKKGKTKPCEILSHKDYITKVEKKQKKSAFWNDFWGGMAASSAGYSSSTTTTSNSTNISSTYSGGSLASGAVIGNNGYAAGSAAGVYGGTSNTNISNSGRSTTANYDGAAAYNASKIQQQESRAYREQLDNTRNELYAGYLKTITIQPDQTLSGYFMIKYEKREKMNIKIPINGITYETVWELTNKKK